MSRRRLPTLLPLAVALAAAGCSLAPAPTPPPVTAPQLWRAEAGAPAPGAAVPADWWRAFADPALDALVAEALAANRDLARAVARVDEARALARVARADRLPGVDLEASAARGRTSEAIGVVPPGADPVGERGRVAASLAFELDLFGRVRNQAEAARQDLLAAGYARDAVRLAVASEVATAYFDLLALDRQVAVTEKTIESRRRGHELIELRYRGGLASRLDFERSRAERAGAEATLPELQSLQRARENGLAILLGRMPGAVERGAGLETIGGPEIPAGLPSELLLRRPDVAAAEAGLAAAAARIGSARAALFPSIVLTGAYGRESTDLSNLFMSPATIWQAAAGLLAPIFDGGRNRALVAAARARQQQAVIGYLQTAEGAFREVEDALFAIGARRRRVAALAEQTEALTSAAELARLRYQEGEAGYLEVLDAERFRLAAELALAAGRRDALAAGVDLFRALGGGWSAAPAAGVGPAPAAKTN